MIPLCEKEGGTEALKPQALKERMNVCAEEVWAMPAVLLWALGSSWSCLISPSHQDSLKKKTCDRKLSFFTIIAALPR